MKETILCAAINIDDTIIPGFRHGDCFDLAQKLYPDIAILTQMQGFLTSSGRFVSRGIAFNIAAKAGQITSSEKSAIRILQSEDLY